ncbi:CMGC/DYRK protein kinase [Saprolegnia parasitica CBS 223.65]|uniref:CMGC/DYRK protein kinase n=1 Tax=Saprolegnia parasitica (strain CBS 223.65) TaxID=695850 RepID=A0A067CSS7_SAPPC|nr:CMGC/DYRK protein kinase [Saprolegnia parasitica CBS 223.65]KDO33729.1 CMGC/DYRK protein kinase [Saprolegnia parasitica CBS 223.65]|eukprot:XP_012195749.1 CMGC/DYRK protein kinase [Saprolegnia parasitica CBS 223.65]
MDLIHGTTRLDDRFLFLREIGHGISGVVLLALDTRSQTQVAIKVFAPALLVAGELEVALLRAVDARDPDHHVPIVSFIHAFEFRGSLCIAMELLGPAIFQRPRASAEDDASTMSSILEQVRQRPDKCVARRHMELAALRTMVAQTCAALSVLHDMNIIHADLKPENILYRDASSRCDIKLIDFGNAIDNVSVQTMATDHGFDIQTILYRAPEVAMGVSISCAADMWSLGCIVLECVLGQPLFNATDRVALLVQMQQLSATPLTTILSRGLYTSAFERQATLPTLSLDAIADAYALDATDRHLRSFLASLLETSPTQRMTAKQVRRSFRHKSDRPGRRSCTRF